MFFFHFVFFFRAPSYLLDFFLTENVKFIQCGLVDTDVLPNYANRSSSMCGLPRNWDVWLLNESVLFLTAWKISTCTIFWHQMVHHFDTFFIKRDHCAKWFESLCKMVTQTKYSMFFFLCAVGIFSLKVCTNNNHGIGGVIWRQWFEWFHGMHIWQTKCTKCVTFWLINEMFTQSKLNKELFSNCYSILPTNHNVGLL